MDLNVEVIDKNEGAITLFFDALGEHSNFLPPVFVNSVADMVSKLKLIQKKVPITRLYVQGHGSPGYMAVGAGKTHDTTGDLSLQLDASGELKGMARVLLAQLAGGFTKNAIVTLGGCQTGRDPSGRPLLQKVSQALGGIAVQAGTDDQDTFPPGMEGTIWRCTPNGCVALPSTWWDPPGY